MTFTAILFTFLSNLLSPHLQVTHLFETLKGLLEKPNRELVSKLLGDVRLLTRKELSRLFPAASIHVEHVLFWPKSYIAVFTSSAD